MPAAGLLKDVPLATLAAVLVYVATRIFHGKELLAIARFDRFEFALALVTLLAVALVGVEQGIGVAVGLAILDRTRLSSRPRMHVLGHIPNSTSWTPQLSARPRRGAGARGAVYSSLSADHPLWYANGALPRRRSRPALHPAPWGRSRWWCSTPSA